MNEDLAGITRWEEQSLPEGRYLQYLQNSSIEGQEVGAFALELTEATKAEGNLILDLSQVEYLDDQATEVLMQVDSVMKQRGHHLVICGLSNGCLELFQLTGVDCLLTLAPDPLYARVLLAKREAGKEEWH